MGEQHDVLGYLTSKGLNYKRAGGYEVNVACMFHGEPPDKRGRLYINVDPNAEVPGLYQCKVCDEKGNLITLMRHFGDSVSQKDEDTYDRFEIFGLAAGFYAKELRLHDDVLDYLHGPERGLKDETIKTFKLGYAPQAIEQDLATDTVKEVPTRSLYNYLKKMGYEPKQILDSGLCTKRGDKIIDSLAGMVTIPYMVAGNVVDIRGRTWPKRDDRPKYKTCSGRDSRLFNTDSLWGREDVIATEGEFDAIALEQLGFKAVAFPGAKSWQDSWDGYFARLKRVWLVFDRDEAGESGAKKVQTKIGAKARRLFLSEEGTKCDPTEWISQGHTKEDFDQILQSARRGNLLVSVREARDEFYEVQDQPGLQFGWEALDVMIEPGLQASQLMILLAKTGCLTGDTEIAVNRAGKGFKIKLKDAYERWRQQQRSNWNWDPSIPTFIQRADDGVVQLGQIDEIWDSGVKPVYELRTTTGRTIKATAKHPFLTPEGWTKLGEIEPGHEVYVNAGRSTKGRTQKSHYYYRSGLVHHPYRNRRDVKAGGNSVPLHRLVVEAADSVGSIDVDSFIERCRTGDVEGLCFLDPAKWAVHHIDHNPFNNERSNLRVMTHEQHAALHAREGTARNVLEQVGLEEVESITFLGEQQTYDISVLDDPHNFMANGFVVHNTGKTITLLNMMDRMRRVPGQEDLACMFVSLEQTRGEWWDRARRIYRFYDGDANDEDAFRWWEDNMYLVDRNRLTEVDLRVALEDYQYQKGKLPDVMCIDYLGYWARAFRGEAYERSSAAVMALKAIAKDMKVPIICPHQVSRVGKDGEEFAADAARDSGVIEETADFLMTIWSPDNALARSEEEKSGRIHMRLAKSRHGGRGTLLNLQFAPISLALLPEGDRLCGKARREVTWRRDYKDNWEKALYRHKTGHEGHLDHVPEIVEQEELSAYEQEALVAEQRRFH